MSRPVQATVSSISFTIYLYFSSNNQKRSPQLSLWLHLVKLKIQVDSKVIFRTIHGKHDSYSAKYLYRQKQVDDDFCDYTNKLYKINFKLVVLA